jgi:hypothetical protein
MSYTAAKNDKYDYSDGNIFAIYKENGTLASIQHVVYTSGLYVNLSGYGAFRRDTGVERGGTRVLVPATQEQIETRGLVQFIEAKISLSTPMETLRKIEALLRP